VDLDPMERPAVRPTWSTGVAGTAFLRYIADRTKDLRWSPTLLQLVLDELHIEDLFVDLVGDPRSVAVRRYPQAIAVALALRHSWRPDDLARVRRRLAVAARPQ
jgi:hypothetical protein